MIKKTIIQKEEEFIEEKDPSILILEIDRQLNKLETLKQSLAETEDQRMERIKSLLKGK
jgi:hypothetical protein